MALQDNQPQVADVLTRLTALPAGILSKFSGTPDNAYPLLSQLLEQAISWVEDECQTSFNATWLPAYGVDYESGYDYDYVQAEPGATYATLADGTKVGLEKYDGNGTNTLTVRKRPILDVALLQVETPILGYTRVYTREEIKLYARQGMLRVFTYKLAVQQALLQTVDYQAWGNLFPPLPQCVQIAYAWGFPNIDPDCAANDRYTGIPINGLGTSFDGGHSWIAGDQRDRELSNWLTNLQEAAILSTVLAFLGQCAGLGRGVIQSVSFDGYSRAFAGTPFAAEIQAIEDRRDKLIERRKRSFTMSTVG